MINISGKVVLCIAELTMLIKHILIDMFDSCLTIFRPNLNRTSRSYRLIVLSINISVATLVFSVAFSPIKVSLGCFGFGCRPAQILNVFECQINLIQFICLFLCEL